MIKVTNLKKSYGLGNKTAKVAALKGIDLSIEQGSFFTLLGASGCGKTTTLRCIAGLEQPDAGEITIGELTVCSKGVSVPPNRRGIGMVFQSYAIWPHMTVFENVAFPLTEGGRKFNKATIREKVHKVLELVHLDGLENRQAPQLSGGQQQRLALARALVAEPQVLLLDEPLSNLDAKLREEMRTELRALVKSLGITTVYVTHDQVEALASSDQIALINDGLVVQIGTPRELYDWPKSIFVAQFIGTNNFLPGVVTGCRHAGLLVINIQGAQIVVNGEVKVGEEVVLGIRPHQIKIAKKSDALPEGNVLEGKIKQVAFLGDVTEYKVGIKGIEDKIILVRGGPEGLFQEQEKVYLHLPACSLKLFDYSGKILNNDGKRHV